MESGLLGPLGHVMNSGCYLTTIYKDPTKTNNLLQTFNCKNQSRFLFNQIDIIKGWKTNYRTK